MMLIMRKWLSILLVALFCIGGVNPTAFAASELPNKVVASVPEIKEKSDGMTESDILKDVIPEEVSSTKDSVEYQLNESNNKKEVNFGDSKILSNSSSIKRNDKNISSKKSLLSTQTNTPPIADLKYLILNEESLYNGKITKETQIAWLYAYNGESFTYDPDGDEITNMTVGGLPENAIIGEIEGMGFITQLPSPGMYKITFQVEDEHGALSNIVAFSIEVVDYNAITEVKLNTYKALTSIPEREDGRYMDYGKGLDMLQNGESDPKRIWDNTLSLNYPSDLPQDIMDSTINVSGKISHPNGSPKTNSSVLVYIPLTYGYSLNETVTTDSEGRFNIKKEVAKDIYKNYDVYGYFQGDTTGKYTKYCYVNRFLRGQHFYYPTKVYISSEGQLYQKDICVTVGYVLNTVLLAGGWIWTTVGNNISLQWYRFR